MISTEQPNLILKQARIRHITSIDVRNIEGSLTDRFSLSLHTSPSLPAFFHSTTITGTLNPHWQVHDFKTTSPILSRSQYLTVKVWRECWDGGEGKNLLKDVILENDDSSTNDDRSNNDEDDGDGELKHKTLLRKNRNEINNDKKNSFRNAFIDVKNSKEADDDEEEDGECDGVRNEHVISCCNEHINHEISNWNEINYNNDKNKNNDNNDNKNNNGNNKNKFLLMELQLNLTKMTKTNPKMAQSNMLMVGMHGGLFVANNNICHISLFSNMEIDMSHDNDTKPNLISSYRTSSLKMLCYMHKKIEETKRKVVELKDVAAQQIRTHNLTQKLQSLQGRREMLLRERVVREGECRVLHQQHQKVLLTNQASALGLEETEAELMRMREELHTDQVDYFRRREASLKEMGMLLMRRRLLLSQLFSIFPITSHEKQMENSDKKSKQTSPHYSILNVPLPADETLTSYDEVVTSVALGYTARLVQLMAAILDLPLKYPITFKGSRSTISDYIFNKIQQQDFSLHLKNKQRLENDYALYLLNIDIAQLRHHFRLNTPSLIKSLANLHSLFLAKLAGHHVTEAPALQTNNLQPIKSNEASMNDNHDTTEHNNKKNAGDDDDQRGGDNNDQKCNDDDDQRSGVDNDYAKKKEKVTSNGVDCSINNKNNNINNNAKSDIDNNIDNQTNINKESDRASPNMT